MFQSEYQLTYFFQQILKTKVITRKTIKSTEILLYIQKSHSSCNYYICKNYDTDVCYFITKENYR